MQNMLLTYKLGRNNWYSKSEKYLYDEYLVEIVFTIGATHNTKLSASPSELVFGRDLMIGTQHIANWKIIAERKQKIATNNNIRENKGRIEYFYRVGDFVLLNDKHRKLDDPYQGSFPIINLYSNGSVEIQKGSTLLKVNMRQIHPFRRRRMQWVEYISVVEYISGKSLTCIIDYIVCALEPNTPGC